MKQYDMREALYALPDGVVQPRRKPLLMPIMIFMLGVAVLAVNILLDGGVEYDNIKSALVLFGALFVLVGATLIVLRLRGVDMAPWHAKDGCFLVCEEKKFQKERLRELKDLVNKRDFTTLRALPEDGVSAVTAVIYRSPRGSFCAVQLFEYVDLELQPASELKVIA
jgi:hypothetical protein